MSVKVDIWSDIACPWCYIGKRKFEAALDAFGGDVEVEYHAYQLSPGAPEEFEGHHRDHLAQHLGVPEATAAQMIERVQGVAASVGLAYDYDALQTTNTGLAHQLLHHAKAHGLQRELKERLLAAYFVEGRHVGRVDDLADLAAEVGLDREEALTALKEGTYRQAVEDDIAGAARFGITGVPFYVIDEKYGVSGAQDSSLFLTALRRASADAA